MLLEVPVLDIATFHGGDVTTKRRLADEVGRAINDIGFLVITGHGIDPDLIARVQTVPKAFFDLPISEKNAVLRPAQDVTRGYIPLDHDDITLHHSLSF
ncbi:MAG: 2-oxoglutarate and iron-dependent oxygenase domain-containing protein [Roseomonas sp.]|nr:2-oxoglutarate and iron-dependent oxygenase domain-containing protein [Roseomonas sp.]MCA3386843.1 2-oxoglutarate and iron-dependent oxygenase domain-containing protein [Roseomonas sp.]MCA3397740.1 2-oxoglutarate and iron-dependent oxygenase domain-containing protein [Roseomonas sp.]MCA3399474.1 2-oxoglutarate and iron-dependent oxygenase domain-containing protein [Roseomonas sp.]